MVKCRAKNKEKTGGGFLGLFGCSGTSCVKEPSYTELLWRTPTYKEEFNKVRFLSELYRDDLMSKWHIALNAIKNTGKISETEPRSFKFSPNYKYLFEWTNTTIKVWYNPNGNELRTQKWFVVFSIPNGFILQILFSNDSKYFAICTTYAIYIKELSTYNVDIIFTAKYIIITKPVEYLCASFTINNSFLYGFGDHIEEYNFLSDPSAIPRLHLNKNKVLIIKSRTGENYILNKGITYNFKNYYYYRDYEKQTDTDCVKYFDNSEIQQACVYNDSFIYISKKFIITYSIKELDIKKIKRSYYFCLPKLLLNSKQIITSIEFNVILIRTEPDDPNEPTVYLLYYDTTDTNNPNIWIAPCNLYASGEIAHYHTEGNDNIIYWNKKNLMKEKILLSKIVIDAAWIEIKNSYIAIYDEPLGADKYKTIAKALEIIKPSNITIETQRVMKQPFFNLLRTPQQPRQQQPQQPRIAIRQPARMLSSPIATYRPPPTTQSPLFNKDQIEPPSQLCIKCTNKLTDADYKRGKCKCNEFISNVQLANHYIKDTFFEQPNQTTVADHQLTIVQPNSDDHIFATHMFNDNEYKEYMIQDDSKRGQQLKQVNIRQILKIDNPFLKNDF